MSDLIIDNHIIKKDIIGIIDKIKSQLTNGKLLRYKNISAADDNLMITCPHHAEGQEKKPSCGIYIGNSPNQTWGNCNCFACGFKGPLYHFVAECFDKPDAFGKEWLKKNFTERTINSGIEEILLLDPIQLEAKFERKPDSQKLEETLKTFQSWHPYLAKRKLSKDVCAEFEVKYDPATQCVVFPVRDVSGKLLFFTRRSVEGKRFIIDSNVDKPVYLLNNVIKKHIQEVYVVESQINALTLYSWGYPAIALFGTGTKEQYSILNKADIYIYHLCFDGDAAGRAGAARFINNIKKSCIIDVINLPAGKDVNDLTQEEFEKLKNTL